MPSLDIINPEPYRIKVVEPIQLPSLPRRESLLKQNGYNVVILPAKEIFIDLLTDSGMGALSHFQWGKMMQADESYSGASSFDRLKEAVEGVLGFKQFFPCHQGRAAEAVLAAVFLKRSAAKPGAAAPSLVVPSNLHFDTTENHIRYLGATPVNLIEQVGLQFSNQSPFKGNMDVVKLREFILKTREGNSNAAGAAAGSPAAVRVEIPLGMLTITCNSNGGQPVSMQNIREVSKVYKEFNIPFYMDVARFAENAFWIKQREEGYQTKSIPEIVLEMFSYCDGFVMSAKKDAIVSIGGLIATRDDRVAGEMGREIILREGFLTYGGLAGRDLESMAVGLREGVDEGYLRHRLGQVQYLFNGLKQLGVPLMEPCGGSVLFIDASRVFPHIPKSEMPGQTLVVELYRRGGIRSGNMNAKHWVYEEPAGSGIKHNERVDVVRLALPRRVYTKSHLDWVIATFAEVMALAPSIRGYTIPEAPDLMKMAGARFVPVQGDSEGNHPQQHPRSKL